MSKPIELLTDPDFIRDITTLSQRAVAAKYGIAGSTVSKWRTRLLEKDGRPVNDKIETIKQDETVKEVRETFPDGSRTFAQRSDRTVNLGDWRAWIESTGDDPDDYNPGVRSTVKNNADGTETFWNQLKASPKLGRKPKEAKLDLAELFAQIRNDEPAPITPLVFDTATYVLVIADLQVGKVETHGGTPELLGRLRVSLDAAINEIKRLNPYEVVIVDGGDIIENLANVSTQLASNDLDLTEQIRVARSWMLRVVREVAPLAPVVQYVAVSSNHGRVRQGLKNAVGGVNDDYGIDISYALEEALSVNPVAYGHVTFTRSTGTDETVALDTYGNTRIGVAHGHQANNQNAIGSWWQGQALGRGPIADADILVTGHYHNFRVETVGDGRYILGAPSSDGGSSWYTNKTGNSARSGFLGFSVADGEFDNLKVL